MNVMMPTPYDPRTFEGLTFHDVVTSFRDGSDTPRHYLERCLETIAEVEPVVKAFSAINDKGARAAADASGERWKAGYPLSPVDGMPIGIKDLLETKDMPTQMGCEAYYGNFPKRDNAAVWALRQAGAIILCKTVTAELGGSHPGPTNNPFDTLRTPGGSSSGSAAAVAASMLPTAIGTQVGGSIIRPAGYCGNVAIKPSQGAINRGERQATSMSTHGVHANCIEDVWWVAIEITKRAGGDRGYSGLVGPDAPPAASRPNRLFVMQGDGWKILDDASKLAFESILTQLDNLGIQIIWRADEQCHEALEQAIEGAGDVCSRITSWENRWLQQNLVSEFPDGVSERAKAILAKAEAMSPADYRMALARRAAAQACHERMAPFADAAISMSCPGPAPLHPNDLLDRPLALRPTGDAIFNYPSSMLFAPAVTMPLIGVRGLPVGVQVVGQQGEDARMTAIARWIIENVVPVNIP